MRKLVVALVLGAMMLSGCALYTQTSFSEYRGPSEFVGGGGTVKTVDGIDVWTSGEPDRRYRILGIIEQSHSNDHWLLGTGLANNVTALIAGATKDSAIIATAKKYGGDAIIFLGSDSVITGYTTRGRAWGQSTGAYSGNYGGGAYGGTYSGNSFAYGAARTRVNTETATRVAVIKYLE